MVAQVGAGLSAETVPVGAWQDAGKLDHGAFAELVGEVRVDDRALGLVDEPDQGTDPSPGELEHRQGDVDPPLVAAELVEELLLGLHRGDGGLAEQGGGDVLDLATQPLEQHRVALKAGQLQPQQDQVEAFGVLVVISGGRWQAGEVVGDVAGLLRGQRRPRRPVRVGLHPLPGGADQEVLHVHPGHHRVQSQAVSTRRPRSLPSPSPTSGSPAVVSCGLVLVEGGD